MVVYVGPSGIGSCQNYGPLVGTLNIRCRRKNPDPKRDHNSDNHPHSQPDNSQLQSIFHTLRIKTAQKPYIVWSLGPKALVYESLDP